jgi:hypothetical protein
MVCKTFMRRFDPGPRLQLFSNKITDINRLSPFPQTLELARKARVANE